MEERKQISEETRAQFFQFMMEYFQQEKDKKLRNFQQQNPYVPKGAVLFTGSSLMEQFPITEFCLSEGLPPAYNRGIGGYTTDEFLAAIDTVLLDVRPRRLFINIGTNDIRERTDGEDWLEHLTVNYRKICGIIREKLPDTEVFLMAYYPANGNIPAARENPAARFRTRENIARANRAVEALAAEFGFRYIDVGGGLKDENGDLKAEHTADGIHFDAAAYRTVFDRLREYL